MPPILPNTPPDSLFWRIVHFPLVLLVLGIAAMMAASIAAGFAVRMIKQASGGNEALLVPGALVIAAIFGGVYWLFVHFVERRPVAELSRPGWLRELGAGIIAGVALFSVVVGVIAALGGYRVIGTHPIGVLVPMIGIAITSGVTEEIMLRGIVFRIVESWLGSGIALVLSAALFGALHLGNPNATPLAAIAIALEAGVMLAALYMLTRRLWAAIGLHGAWNLTQGGVYGIAVSGLDQDGLLRPRITGPDLLTGGAFGAEASLPAILIATAFGIALLYTAWKQSRFVAPFWRRKAEAK